MIKKLARLIRFVGPGVLKPRVAALYDKEQNLMTIDKWIFDHVNLQQQTNMMFADNDTHIES